MTIDQDILRTETAIGCHASYELCSNCLCGCSAQIVVQYAVHQNHNNSNTRSYLPWKFTENKYYYLLQFSTVLSDYSGNNSKLATAVACSVGLPPM